MYPTLFTIGGFRVDSYSVIWFTALLVAILWDLKRIKLYELDEDEARKIMSIAYLFMLLGARSPEYFSHWRAYLDKPSLFLDLNRGGLHEFGAVLGAFVSALVLCLFSKKRVSFFKLCDAAAIPAMLTIAIGRWGCFLNGCCVGVRSNSIFAVHFPRDPVGVTRHPVQIYYSVMAFAIVLILLWVEKKISPAQKRKYHCVIAPLSLIFYTLMRYVAIPFRDRSSIWVMTKKAWTYKYIALAFPFEILWLAWGIYCLWRDGRELDKKISVP